MRKKIIISLILAMCCIMASVPVSAATDDFICKEHGPFYEYVCRATVGNGLEAGYREDSSSTVHRYYVGDSLISCPYTRFNASTIAICSFCGEDVDSGASHFHGSWGHMNPAACGGRNERVCNLSDHSYN